MIAALYFELALKEAVEISTAAADFVTESKFSPLQRRYADLAEHLNRKHSLID